MIELSSTLERLLRKLISVGRIWPDEVLSMEEPSNLYYLVTLGFAVQKQEDPNLLRYLPEHRQGQYFFAPTAAGIEYIRLLEESRQKLAKEKADEDRQKRADDEKAVLDRKKQYRHDFVVAAFGVIVALLVEHFATVFDFCRDFLVRIFSN